MQRGAASGFSAWRPTFRVHLVRSMSSRIGKRRAVVTGAAGGIGKAVAQRLLAEGVDVMAVDIDPKRLEGAAAAGCGIHVADLSDPVQREALSAPLPTTSQG